MQALIEINEGDSNAILTMLEGDREVKKSVSIDTLVSLLNSSTVAVSGNSTHIGQLPKEYYDLWYLDNENFTIAFYIEGSRRALLNMESDGEGHSKEKPYVVPYPNLLMFIGVSNGQLSRGNCFAVKDSREDLSLLSELYQFPFSNVSTEGNICFGGNANMKLELKTISDVLSRFYSSPYNGDYYVSSSYTLANLKMADLLKLLQKNEEFPEEILVSTKKSVGDVLSSMNLN